MKVTATWIGQEKIRVTLMLAPGELHPKVGTPLEVEEWLRTLLEPREPAPRKVVVAAGPKAAP